MFGYALRSVQLQALGRVHAGQRGRAQQDVQRAGAVRSSQHEPGVRRGMGLER